MPTIDAAIEEFITHRRMRGVTPSSLALYERWLKFWVAWRHQQPESLPATVSRIEIAELRAFFVYASSQHAPHDHPTKRGLAPASIDSLWRLLAAFWRFCDGEGWLTAKQRPFFHGGRIPRPRLPIKIHETYDDQTLEALLRACISAHHPGHQPDREQEVRDQLIILLFWSTGMRIGELVRLEDSDVDLEEMHALVNGKTGPRWVFWDARTAHALAEYLEHRSGPPDGPLLRSTWGYKRGLEGLSTSAVRALLKRMARRAGVKLIPNAPVHGWRATFIQDLFDAGADISDVQQFVGHRDPRTTAIYARASTTRLRRKYDRLRRGGAPESVDTPNGASDS